MISANDVTFVSSFVSIGELIQKLKWRQHDNMVISYRIVSFEVIFPCTELAALFYFDLCTVHLLLYV